MPRAPSYVARGATSAGIDWRTVLRACYPAARPPGRPPRAFFPPCARLCRLNHHGWREKPPAGQVGYLSLFLSLSRRARRVYLAPRSTRATPRRTFEKRPCGTVYFSNSSRACGPRGPFSNAATDRRFSPSPPPPVRPGIVFGAIIRPRRPAVNRQSIFAADRAAARSTPTRLPHGRTLRTDQRGRRRRFRSRRRLLFPRPRGDRRDRRLSLVLARALTGSFLSFFFFTVVFTLVANVHRSRVCNRRLSRLDLTSPPPPPTDSESYDSASDGRSTPAREL